MINLLLSFFFFLWLSPNVPTADDLHEFHVSKCIVEHSQDDQALQISLHIFIDDLEEALEKQGVDSLFLCTKKESKKADEYLYDYFQKKIQFEVDQEALSYNYIGKEPSEDLQAIWCYLEIENITNYEEINISNDLLMELFDDQKNIINFKIDGKPKGYFLFQKGKSRETIQF